MQIIPATDVTGGSVSLKGSVLPLFPASSKCHTNKHPSVLLLVFISLVPLHVSVCMTGRGLSTLVQDINTLAGGEDSSSLLRGSKAEMRKINKEFKIIHSPR